ncbi:MAG: hypothetical protein ACOYMD_09235 [Paludibacter sp.]
MENEITNSDNELESKLYITLQSSDYLKTTAKWANFLAILGFVGIAFMVLAGVLMMIFSPIMNSSSAFGSSFAFPIVLMGVLYILIAVLYYFPTYYLYNFANKTKLAIITNNQEMMNDSFNNLKKVFKFIGIMTIVLISLYLFMIPVIIFLSISKSIGI